MASVNASGGMRFKVFGQVKFGCLVFWVVTFVGHCFTVLLLSQVIFELVARMRIDRT